jgi:hypothetical protein
MVMEQLYYTKRVFKDGSKPRIVDENLTREEAQAQVEEDIKNNPNAEYYMLVFAKQESNG